MKINKIFLILTVLWMALIFVFSSRNGDLSANDSYKAGMFAAGIFVPGFNEWPDNEQMELALKIDHPVRKCAHAFEYGILGILCWLTLKKLNSALLKAWLVSSLYAASDEFHQLFVSGRSGQLKDVLNDSLAALVFLISASLLVYLTVKLISRKKEKKS